MDKVTAKLDKAQQTVQVNEAEYKNYLRALKDTNTRWVTDWKAWCDVSNAAAWSEETHSDSADGSSAKI